MLFQEDLVDFVPLLNKLFFINLIINLNFGIDIMESESNINKDNKKKYVKPVKRKKASKVKKDLKKKNKKKKKPVKRIKPK